MPNNCSALVQRKQHVLHKILRSSSEGKLQNAIAETTAELHVAGTRKIPAHSSSTDQLTNGLTGPPTTRRSNLFTNNRIQPTADQIYQTHLPSIRDAAGHVERQHQLSDDLYSRPHSKTPLTSTSPKSTGRPPSASMSSIYNTLAKRSTENFMSSYGEIGDLLKPSSHRSRRQSNASSRYGAGTIQTMTKQTITPQKYSGDSGVDSRYSFSPPDINQQHRTSSLSNKIRSTVPNVQVETPLVHETITKERTNNGQIYQRRMSNNAKTPIKQKIDKYRRRSDEATQATNGNIVTNTANAGLSATTPALNTPSLVRPKPPPPPSPTPVRRVTSDGEIQSRLEILHLTMDTNIPQTNQQQQKSSRHRVKSPFLYSTHQQLALPETPRSPSVSLRRNQPVSSATPSQNHQNNVVNYVRQQQLSSKQSITNSQGNLYLAFVASRHVSALEDPLFESDIDHSKLLQIFKWLKNVEGHRYEQLDHDKLLIEQNQRMLDQEEDLSLYSEIQHAVDDLPPNTNGNPCEKIATMQFED